jgi:hypothetical protein
MEKNAVCTDAQAASPALAGFQPGGDLDAIYIRRANYPAGLKE